MSTPSPSRLISFLVLAVFFGCQSRNQLVTPPPPKVTAAKPVERAIADTVEFVGTTEPTKTVDLRARVGGYLKKILFTDGTNVKAGDLLFVIDQAPYQAALESALAAQQKAVASLALAQSQLRRMTPLVGSAITQEEYDVQSAQVETAKADVAAASADVKRAQQDLGYTEIKAPISGRIGRHMVDVGNLVQAQVTPLANIQTLDPIYAIFDVSENELLRFMEMLRKNQLPDPEKNPVPLRLGLADETGFPHEGKLDYRELTIDPQTGTTMRRAIFPNPGWQILPGMDVHVQGQVGQPQPKLLVDERAIGTDQRGDYLLVVNDKNVVEYRMIKPGSRVGGMRVIESGVNKNDWVIVNGLQRARPGATVNPEKTTMADQLAAESHETAPQSGAATKNGSNTVTQTSATSKSGASNAGGAAKSNGAEENKQAAAPNSRPTQSPPKLQREAPPVESGTAPPQPRADAAAAAAASTNDTKGAK